jgi:hypothetical protein
MGGYRRATAISGPGPSTENQLGETPIPNPSPQLKGKGVAGYFTASGCLSGWAAVKAGWAAARSATARMAG